MATAGNPSTLVRRFIPKNEAMRRILCNRVAADCETLLASESGGESRYRKSFVPSKHRLDRRQACKVH
jgi:hypothetical protein